MLLDEEGACVVFFFFNDTATTEIYTLSLHDALPIWMGTWPSGSDGQWKRWATTCTSSASPTGSRCASWRRRLRSEEHTSELQSRQYLVCRLLLEKKNYPPCSPCPSNRLSRLAACSRV